MFDGKFRAPVDRAVKPIGNGLRRTGLTPDHLTFIGLAVACGAAVAIGFGQLKIGLLLVVLAALPDLFDGALAKASNTSSQRGAFFDSVVDRVTDALLYGGVAWYLASHHSPHTAILPMAVMGMSSVISYQRAKAESLGLDAKGGLMERAERIIALCLGLLFSVLLIPVLWLTLLLTMVTAVQRFVKVWKQAAVAPLTAQRIELRRSRRQTRRVVRTERRRTRISRPGPPPIARPAVADEPSDLDRARKRMSDAVTIGGYRFGALAARLMPGPVALGAASSIGFTASLANSARRRMIERHLQRVNPRLRGPALRVAVGQAFDSYAKYYMESFRLPHLSKRTVADGLYVDGWEHVTRSVAGGKGTIFALPHLGGWEWAGRWMADKGYRLTVVVESLDPPELFEWFADLRKELGMTIVPTGPGAGTAVLKALRENQIVCLLCDRDLERNGVEVEFFGERTTLPAGPATLSLRTGAPLLPVGVYYTDDYNGHMAIVRPPIPQTRLATMRVDVTRITQLLANELEFLIRRAPEQWHLFQPNWPSDPGYEA